MCQISCFALPASVNGPGLLGSIGVQTSDFGIGILVNARWAPCIRNCCKISDRIGYVDLVLNGTKYRIIAVYIPHAGYNIDYFTVCFNYLRKAVLDGQRLGMRCMIGGDFNTERNRGWRGDRLEELVCELGLDVCKNPNLLPFEDLWTFRSCL